MTYQDLKVVNNKEEMRELVFRIRRNDKSVGFVPTMGYLHQGHLALVEKAKEMTDQVVVSIYVNPTQFSKGEDLTRYPRNLNNDLRLLKDHRVDFVFLPDEDKMYNQDHLTWVQVTQLEDRLCGRSRKGHFRGVTTIVLKLLNIVNPDLMFMGEKDFQQTVILEKMISDLDLPVRIVRCPTVREADGLAMSSRNSYLSPDGRQKAVALYKALQMAKEMFQQDVNDPQKIVNAMKRLIEEEGGRFDYIEIFDSKTLQPLSTMISGCRIALAVYFDGARLIDNIEIT